MIWLMLLFLLFWSYFLLWCYSSNRRGNLLCWRRKYIWVIMIWSFCIIIPIIYICFWFLTHWHMLSIFRQVKDLWSQLLLFFLISVYLSWTFIYKFRACCLSCPISIWPTLSFIHIRIINRPLFCIFISKDTWLKILELFVSAVVTFFWNVGAFFGRRVAVSLLWIFPISTTAHECAISLFTSAILINSAAMQFFIFSLFCSFLLAHGFPLLFLLSW